MADAFHTGRPSPGDTSVVGYEPADPHNIYSDPPPEQKKAEPEPKPEPKPEPEPKAKAKSSPPPVKKARVDVEEGGAQIDTSKYDNMLAEIQSRYDEQLKDFQAEVDAAQKAQETKLAELTEQTDKRKKKVKKGRKFGRLSLLYALGSELGIPNKTDLG